MKTMHFVQGVQMQISVSAVVKMIAMEDKG
jgi:hypothetical protein